METKILIVTYNLEKILDLLACITLPSSLSKFKQKNLDECLTYVIFCFFRSSRSFALALRFFSSLSLFALSLSLFAFSLFTLFRSSLFTRSFDFTKFTINSLDALTHSLTHSPAIHPFFVDG